MQSVAIGISALLFLLPVPGSSQYLDGRCGLLPNGKIADDMSSPWMAYIHTSELLYVCGGSVITEKLVLTAAHCTRANEQLVVRVGEFMEADDDGDGTILSEHQVIQTFIHPLYNMTANANDIAIFGLATDIVFSKTIKPICIMWWTIWRGYIDRIQVLSGARWDQSKDRNESYPFSITDIRRQPATMCSILNGTALLSSQFCAGDSDTKLCNADYSTPLGAIITFNKFKRFVLIGIATTNQSCNRASVYTDVLSYTEFILSVWRHYRKGERQPSQRGPAYTNASTLTEEVLREKGRPPKLPENPDFV
ncbi:vitamin K-dependent protein C [Drosophila santomea]|uniref:vitamin K-dependent protein C n=1 Tax=Drosophila santomea TaxID=129105 RepID=UPI0019536106|nr:vitamin K-dependent protein C [Drosophila santomea]